MPVGGIGSYGRRNMSPWPGCGVNFPHKNPHKAVLCIGSKKSVDNTLKLWLLLSSASLHQGCLSNISLAQEAGAGHDFGKVQSQDSWPTDQRIFHNVRHLLIYKSYEKGGREGHVREGLGHFSSIATAMCTEALLPRKKLDIASWWEVKNKYFFPFTSLHSPCFCFIKLPLSWSMRIFCSPSYFLPPYSAEEGNDKSDLVGT